jgi:hypothetical protein
MQSTLKKYGYLWVTLLLFLFSLVGHWYLSWQAYIEDQHTHNQPIKVENYLVEVGRDTLENWQSEFLQLIWQVAGLSYLLYVGSPQSKEGEERKEEKLDLILKKIDPTHAAKELAHLNRKYPKK